jgi:hypothetical protein
MGGGGDEAPTFFYCNETEEMGRGLHSSTFQLNLSRC